MANLSKSEVKSLSSVERELSIVISGENIKREMDQAYQRLSTQVKHKGFRPGKVPRQILEQYYKADVEKDVLNRLLTKSYQEAVVEHSLYTVADPQIQADQPFVPGMDFVYSAKVEIRPEIELKIWEGLEISVPEFAISDADVDTQIENLREAHATIVPVNDRDSILQGDLVECNYSGDVGKSHIKQLTRMNHTIEVGSGQFFTQAEQALIGKKLGEKIEVAVVLPEDFEVESLREKEAILSIVPASIRVKQKPVLDDEFAKDVAEQFSSLEDLRSAILDNLNASKAMRESEAKKSAALDELIKQNPFEIPPSLIQRQAEQQAMRALSSLPKEQAELLWREHGPMMTEESKPQAIKTIQATFLCDAIASAQHITVEPTDIDAELSREASRMRVSVQKLRTYYKKDDLDGLKRRLAAEKALALVIERAHIKIISGPLAND